MRGRLEGYWEQGWEGRIEFAFQPDQGELIWLSAGDRLRIYAADGSLLWEGVLQWRRRRFWESSKQTVWADRCQAGVSYARWLSWFWSQPPLVADWQGAAFPSGK